MTAARFLERFQDVKKVGAQRWSALCPTHNGHALSIKITGELILIHCFAGCSTQAVCIAAGITMKDLFLTNGFRRANTVREQGADEHLGTEQPSPSPTKTFTYDEWKLYEHALGQSIGQSEGLTYIKQRGITKAAAERFHLGFAPGANLWGSPLPTDTLEEAERKKVLRAMPWVGIPYFSDGLIVAAKWYAALPLAPPLTTRDKARTHPGMSTKGVLFNQDGIHGTKPLYIVEGAWDAIVIEQNGHNAIALDSASQVITAEIQARLLEVQANIFLAGDNELSGIGNGKMVALLKELTPDKASLLLWPLRNGETKTDANSFFLSDCSRDAERFNSRLDELTKKAALLTWRYLANSKISTIPRPEPIDGDFFHGPLGKLCNDVSKYSDVDLVAFGMQCLTCLGNIYGRDPHLESGGKLQHANLFLGIIGPTALGRKGSSLGLIMERILPSLSPEWLKSCVQTGLSTGEGIVSRIRDPQVIYGNEEVEGLSKGDKDPGVEDKRVLFVAEELPATLQKAKRRNDGSLSEKCCEAFDSPPFLAIATKKLAMRATNPHVSLIGHGTKPYLQRSFDVTDLAGGFGNRFIWIWSYLTQAILDATVPKEVLAPFCDEMKETVKFAIGVTRISRDPAAEKLIGVAFYRGIAEKDDGLLGEMLARGITHINRLCIIFALMDRSAIIREPHARAAIAAWNYSTSCAQLIFSEKLTGTIEDKVLKILRRNAGGLTKTDVWKLLGTSHQKGTAEVLRALEALEKAGLASRTRNHVKTGIDIWFSFSP